MLAHLRLSLRILQKNWSTSTLAILVMGIGLALTITMLTQLNGILWSQPTAIVGKDLQVLRLNDLEQGPRSQVAYRLVEAQAVAEEASSFEYLTLSQNWFPGFSNPDGSELAQRVIAARVEPEFFSITGVMPFLGAPFSPEDLSLEAAPKAIISYRMWERHYGRSQSVIGESVILNGNAFTISGIMPEGFHFPSTHDLWLPAQWDQWMGRPWSAQPQVNVMGILATGVDKETAQTEVDGILARFAERHPEIGERRVSSDFQSFNEAFVSEQQNRLLWIMLAFAVMVLTISCANVSNLVMAQTAKRSRELALRTALGADRSALIRQVMTDGFMICFFGVWVGFALAKIGIHLIWRFYEINPFQPYWWHMRIEWPIWLGTAGFMILATIGSSLLPALRASSVDCMHVLKDDSRTSSGLYLGRLANLLTTFQIGLSASLLLTAVVMIMALITLRESRRPFDEDAVLTVHMRTNTSFGYATKVEVDQFARRFKERAETIDGIDLVGTTNSFNVINPPFRVLNIGDQPTEADQQPQRALTHIISPDYLPVLGIQMIEGRNFRDTDVEDGLAVCLVSRSLAERFWPGESALGKQIQSPDPQAVPQRWRGVFSPNDTWMTVIGVVPDLEPEPVLGETPLEGELFIPSTQILDRNQQFVMRGHGDMHRHIPAIEAILRELDPNNSPKTPVQTIGDVVALQQSGFSLLTNIFSVFGGVSLFLAFAGLYSVVNFGANLRTREFGVRMALGAQLRHILGHVIKPVFWQIIPGALLGILTGYLILTQFLQQALRVNELPMGWVSYGVVIGTILAACLLASGIPAFRAAKVDPMVALRED